MGDDAGGTNGVRPDPVPRVTVIVPTILTDEAMLNRCITQVHATADVEVLVPQGGTFASNCNQGAADAQGEILCFLNDDTLVQPRWLDPLVQALDDDAHIAGARLIYPDGTIQHAGVYFALHDGVLHGHNWLIERASGPVDAVTGACLAVRKADFMELDGFDETYRNGNEDIDFCLKVRAAGGKVVYCADSTVIHYESRSGAARWAHVAENVRLLNERWKVNA